MGSRTVYRIKLELTDKDGNKIDNAECLKLAKARESISREILIPADLTLYQLHFIIQKAFGWNNLHLHRFSLYPEDFDKVTERKAGGYEELCGVLFRFFIKPEHEWCWHRLFGGIKSENRETVSGMPCSRIISAEAWHKETAEDSYFLNQLKIRAFNRLHLIGSDDRLDRLMRISSYENINVLVERLTISEVFISDTGESLLAEVRDRFTAWKREIENELLICKRELKRLMLDEPAQYSAMLRTVDEIEDLKLRYSELIKRERSREPCKAAWTSLGEEEVLYRDEIIQKQLETGSLLNACNPKLPAYFPEICYRYDLGDDWRINIRCTNIYEESFISPGLFESADHQGAYAADIRSGGAMSWTDRSGISVGAGVCRILNDISQNAAPLCVAADGLNVMDDIGGIEGFFDFLKVINGKDGRQAKRMRELAELYGWKSHRSKPENILC